MEPIIRKGSKVDRYKLVSMIILLLGFIGLFLPIATTSAGMSNRTEFTASFLDFINIASSAEENGFMIIAVIFILLFAAIIILVALGRQFTALGIGCAVSFGVFALAVFPELYKANKIRGLDFGVGFYVTFASLLIYSLNARLKKKDDYDLIVRDFKMNKWIILMAIPVLAYYFIFSYLPMYGVIIGFKNYSAVKGILGSEWIGLTHLKSFFTSIYAKRTITNTLTISFYQLIFSFPAPILLALLLNEIRNKLFKRTVQTITYLPHFISLVVICGIIVDFLSMRGLINDLLALLGLQRHMFMTDVNAYRPIYIISGIWQGIGWGSIIYLAALSGINQELYEAVAIEGAGRLKQCIHVTIPGILPMVVIMLILNIGSFMSEGSEKTILLYNELTYEKADIISSYTYRRGLVEGNFGYSSAIGLFNTVINLILLVSANKLSRKLNETSLW